MIDQRGCPRINRHLGEGNTAIRHQAIEVWGSQHFRAKIIFEKINIFRGIYVKDAT